jgi:hypothetical protein
MSDELYYRAKLIASGVPAAMHEGVLGYLLRGHHPGSFLEAVLSNDLKEACARADELNQPRLFQYVFFLYNYAPLEAWGSPQHVADWISARALEKGA